MFGHSSISTALGYFRVKLDSLIGFIVVKDWALMLKGLIGLGVKLKGLNGLGVVISAIKRLWGVGCGVAASVAALLYVMLSVSLFAVIVAAAIVSAALISLTSALSCIVCQSADILGLCNATAWCPSGSLHYGQGIGHTITSYLHFLTHPHPSKFGRRYYIHPTPTQPQFSKFTLTLTKFFSKSIFQIQKEF